MNKLNVTNLEQENHRKGVKAVRVSSGDSWCVRVVLPRLKIIDIKIKGLGLKLVDGDQGGINCGLPG